MESHFVVVSQHPGVEIPSMSICIDITLQLLRNGVFLQLYDPRCVNGSVQVTGRCTTWWKRRNNDAFNRVHFLIRKENKKENKYELKQESAGWNALEEFVCLLFVFGFWKQLLQVFFISNGDEYFFNSNCTAGENDLQRKSVFSVFLGWRKNNVYLMF
jgi:hypothetical protein